MIAFKGVRSSWLMLATKSDFARVACSLAQIALCSSLSMRLRSLMSARPVIIAGRPSNSTRCEAMRAQNSSPPARLNSISYPLHMAVLGERADEVLAMLWVCVEGFRLQAQGGRTFDLEHFAEALIGIPDDPVIEGDN